jgi:hypothetical protein
VRERSINRVALAGAGVLISAAGAVVTNLITSKWSWGLAVLLAGLVISGAVLAGLLALPYRKDRQRTFVRQAARGGSIINSLVEADSGARVDERANLQGTIRDVHTQASDADVSRVAKDGEIHGGSIKAN